MKFSLLFISILLTQSIYAEEVKPQTESVQIPTQTPSPSAVAPSEALKNEYKSNIMDLSYFPETGKYFGSTDFSSSTTKTTLEYGANVYSKNETKKSSYAQMFGYAPDNLTNLGFQLEYQPTSSSQTTFGAGSTSNGTIDNYKAEKGLESIDLFLRKRIKKQGEGSYNVDAKIVFSPKLGDAVSSSTTKEGKAYNGNMNLEGEVSISKKEGTSEWMISSYLQLDGEKTTVSANDNTDISIGRANLTYGGIGTYQWNSNDNLSFSLTGGIIIVGESKSSNTHDHTENTVESSSSILLAPKISYAATQNLILNFTITGSSTIDGTFTQKDTQTSSITTLAIKDITTSSYQFGIKYLF